VDQQNELHDVSACSDRALGEPHVNRSELWPPEGSCYLCGAVGKLCRSHTIPKFVGDWLRETNITGRLRNSTVPNRLVEDLEWRHLLCEACEGRFNRFETEVCECIFLPIHERRQDRCRHGPSFARFGVSVACRALVVLRQEGHLGHLNEIPADVEAAEGAWRDFLLEGRVTPAPHIVHALPMDVRKSCGSSARNCPSDRSGRRTTRHGKQLTRMSRRSPRPTSFAPLMPT
jgi:hypothetical protein